MYAIHISDNVKESDGITQHAWIVPEELDALRFVNDPQ